MAGRSMFAQYRIENGNAILMASPPFLFFRQRAVRELTLSEAALLERIAQLRKYNAPADVEKQALEALRAADAMRQE